MLPANIVIVNGRMLTREEGATIKAAVRELNRPTVSHSMNRVTILLKYKLTKSNLSCDVAYY